MAMKAARRTLLAFILTVFAVGSAQAAFIDWWLTPDQQGRVLFERGEYAQAAQRFSDPLWKGLAYYASEDFVSAATWLAQVETAYGYFYLGNAMAHQDRLEEALAAYDEALARDPEFTEAQFNRDWVQGLYELSQKEYDDHGGTGGQLGADDFVFDDRAKNAEQTMSEAEARHQGLTDDQIESIWMRRVQTTPAQFLEIKFSYQLTQEDGEE
jgi:Ca-activated chloride channel family protein